jgi:ABC-type Fe3+-siderophore transport system permease subunit
MQVEILGILIPFAFIGFAFASLYVYLTTRNKERLALIEKGASSELFKTKAVPGSAYRSFKLGLFLIGIALGIIAGYLLSEGGMQEEPAYFSMIFLFGGIGLIAAFFLQKKYGDK